MISILYWNIHKLPLLMRVVRLVETHNIDILILTECDAKPQDVLNALNASGPEFFHYPASVSETGLWPFGLADPRGERPRLMAGPAHLNCKPLHSNNLGVVFRRTLNLKSLPGKELQTPCAGPGLVYQRRADVLGLSSVDAAEDLGESEKTGIKRSEQSSGIARTALEGGDSLPLPGGMGPMSSVNPANGIGTMLRLGNDGRLVLVLNGVETRVA